MKPCKCLRCDFFQMAALDLAAMGMRDEADLAATEVTWLDRFGNVAIVPLSQCADLGEYLAQWTTERRAALDTLVESMEGYADQWKPEVFADYN